MITQLDSENADRDLTSLITVLTHTPSATEAMSCQGYIKFGDGTKNLDGTGGAFELTITVGGQTIEPDPQTLTFSTAVRASVWTIPFSVPANEEVILRVKSPNAADTDVDVTAYLFDTMGAVGFPVALDGGGQTVSAMLTKLADDNDGADFDAALDSQKGLAAAIGSIANVGAAINTSATSDSTVSTGSVASGTYADTEGLDGVYWTLNDAAGTLDMYFEFDVGSTGVPTGGKWTGYLQGSNDSLTIYGYNWVTTSWVQVGTVSGTNPATVQVIDFDLFTSMVGTGANAGKVRIRFENTGLTSAVFATDQIFTSYSISQSPVGYANGRIWVDTVNGTAGAIEGVNGVADLPVDNWADALTLSGLTGLNNFNIGNGSSITLTGDSTNYTLIGSNWTLALGGQTITNMVVRGASVTGTATGSSYEFSQCTIADTIDVTVADGLFLQCAIAGNIICSAIGSYFFDQCFSGIAGTATPSIDFGALVLDTALNFRHYSGGIEIKNMGQAGSDTMSLEGWGQYVLNANCIGGVLAIRGHFKKTDNSGGAVTISDDANFKTDVITFGVAQGPGTGTNQIQLATTASAVDGSYDPSMVFIVAGTGSGQSRLVLEYAGSTKTATVDRDWKVAPDATSEYRIVANPGREHVNEGLAQAGASSTITLNALASSDDDAYNGQLVFIRSGTGEDQVRVVADYVGSTKVATVNRAWDTTPDSTSGYVMLPAYALTDCATETKQDLMQADITILKALRQNKQTIDLVASKAYIWNTAEDTKIFEATLTDNAGNPVTTATTGPINATGWTAI